ncbi:MAG: hypothetical protein U9N76_04795 [Candidatus Marinimicrobia bacterium]|nr:hypothetical protein [Candidatus Neomarinimicrobiota bacterium]
MENNTTLFETDINKDSVILAKNDDDLQIELLKQLQAKDRNIISEFLNTQRNSLNPNSLILTKDIEEYFSYPNTLSFVARLKNVPIAFIIAIEIEKLSDKKILYEERNWGKGDTVFIFTSEINENYSKRKYESMLLRISLNWLSKNGFEHIRGYEKKGIAEQKYPGCIITKRFENWKGSGNIYEYFKLSLK